MVGYSAVLITLEEMVEDYQHEAKLSFAKGRCMYTKAYAQFKKAASYAELLPKTPENLHLLATLYANCSLIQLKKENFRTCLNDCKKALDIEVGVVVLLDSSHAPRRCSIGKRRHWQA